ncbi:MAG: hypothetical protein U0P30_06185 [Vicinamibacterales bacterium]
MTKPSCAVLAVVLLSMPWPVVAQPSVAPPADVTSQPLIGADQITYVGAFSLPVLTSASTVEGDTLSYGGYALGLGPDGASLYVGCHDWGEKLARVSIPAMGEQAKVIEPCTTIPKVTGISGPLGLVNGMALGGSLWWHDRLIVSAYTYYDNSAGTSDGHNKTHFAGPAIGQLAGPWRVGNDPPGMIAGNMAVVPEEWRALVGGPVIGGLCCIPIISRSSYGPSISAFNPDDIGTASKVKSEMLVGYPDDHQNLGGYNSAGEFYGMAMTMGGFAWPRGTRAVLAVVNRPTAYCYGRGTTDKQLDGQPTGTGHHYCYDPYSQEQGNHSPDFELSVIVFDAADLAKVKAGRKRPWDVKPVTRINLPNAPKAGQLQSATFDPATGRLYLTPSYKIQGQIYVWQIK